LSLSIKNHGHKAKRIGETGGKGKKSEKGKIREAGGKRGEKGGKGEIGEKGKIREAGGKRGGKGKKGTIG